jgi:hypothetical protein
MYPQVIRLNLVTQSPIRVISKPKMFEVESCKLVLRNDEVGFFLVYQLQHKKNHYRTYWFLLSNLMRTSLFIFLQKHQNCDLSFSIIEADFMYIHNFITFRIIMFSTLGCLKSICSSIFFLPNNKLFPSAPHINYLIMFPVELSIRKLVRNGEDNQPAQLK